VFSSFDVRPFLSNFSVAGFSRSCLLSPKLGFGFLLDRKPVPGVCINPFPLTSLTFMTPSGVFTLRK